VSAQPALSRPSSFTILPSRRLLQVVAAAAILSILFLAWPDGYTLLLTLNVFILLLLFLD